MSNALDFLQNWYLAQCDGDWEHQHGVEIGTLDNPGWRIKVNLAGTELEDAELDREITARTDDDWLHVWIEDREFHAACGPLNLGAAVERFRELVEGDL